MKTLKIPIYKGTEFMFKIGQYHINGNTYIDILCKDEDVFVPWSDLTVNFDEKLKEDEAYIHMNHIPHALYLFLIQEGFLLPLGEFKRSGFVLYPKCRLNLKQFKEYEYKEDKS